MELVFFSTAFICGFLLQQIKLPPLIGFLAAGFILNLFGFTSTQLLENVASLGITLLLFTIGLKLQLSNLAKVHVWAPATIHIMISSMLFSGFMMLMATLGLPLFIDLSLETSILLGFAFSFSSTVFAVKVLEQRGEMNSLHGRVSIGILVMQDIFAVLFLAISTGKVPNIWALGLLIILPITRPMFFWMFNRSKHGELLPMFGFFFALLVGYQSFEFAGLKGDLGALIVGMILAPHLKAKELAKSLLGFKDLMLVGFFLTIGLDAHLSLEGFLIALLFVMILPLKVALYYCLTNLFKLRARTSLLSSLTLTNFSEFGLIVCALAASNQWVSPQWLAVMAIAVSITFIIASPLNTHANSIYVKVEHWLIRFESQQRLDEELPVDLGDSQILIFGMGRIGTGAYDNIVKTFPKLVVGVDISQQAVLQHNEQGRFAIVADAIDPDFWQRINHSKVKMVMLAMPKHIQNVLALEQLKSSGFDGQVSAIANYPDQQRELEQLGVHSTFNFYQEAGAGFAQHVKTELI